MVTVESVDVHSPAAAAGIQPGDVLVSVNGHGVRDVLDYRFYMTDTNVRLVLTRAGKEYAVSISKIAPSDAQAGQIEITLTGDALRRLSAGMRADVRIVLEQCTAPSVPLGEA